MTPWWILRKENSEEVKDLLKPCKDWALAAALRGDNGAETSKMTYILTPISEAPAQVVKDTKARLNGTLGTHVQAKPKEGVAVVLGTKREGHRP